MRRFTQHLPSALLLLALFGALASILAARPVYAASIVVNTNADDTTTDGLCTLREAITNANADAATYPDCTAGSGADTITFAANYTITLSSSLPDITTDITITGNGTTSTIIQAAASAGTTTYRIVKINRPGATPVPNATLEYMTLRYGVESSGGAINVASSSLTLNSVTLSDNQVKDIGGAGLNGGAISFNGGTITINNSTLSNNSVTTSDTTSSVRGSGGAIYAGSGTLTLNNTTVSGNSAIRGGGGVLSNGATININYSTIASNTSNSADGSTAYSSLDGGGINRITGTINLNSSIVVGNKKGVSSAADNDCAGTLSSQDYNLTGSGTGCALAGAHDVAVTPATVFSSVLGPLANNGGSTATHLLYGGNAAQDAIPSGTNSCGSGLFTQDQRGSARPYNSTCDMGAYESQDARPGVAMSTGITSPTNTSPIPVTVTFSESVTGFAAGDITAGNATVSNFTGSGASYSFNLVPSSDGTVTADIAAGVAQDSVLNTNTAASQLSISYDGTPPPAPVVNSPAPSGLTNDTTPTASGTAEANATISVYFDGSLNGTTAADASGNWSYTPSSALTGNTSHTVKVKATDAAGNSSFDSNTNTFTIETTAPNVVGISRFSPASATTNASSVDFFVVFSESSLAGLNSSDFILTTTGAISGASVSSVAYANGASATVTVNTGSGDGSIRLDVKDDDTITDAAGNKLGGTGTGNGDYTAGQSFTIDKTGPTVSMSTSITSPTNTSPIPVTVTFSESVSDFVAGDITAGNATVSNFAGSGAGYSFDLIPSSDGTVTADIAAGVAQDSLLNTNSAASQLSLTYDTSAPSVLSSVRATSNPTRATSVEFIVTFSEAVNGVDASDFSLSTSGLVGASITGVSGGPMVYTISASTGSGNGSIRLDIGDDDTITDTAANKLGGTGTVNGDFSAGELYTVDKTAPAAGSLTGSDITVSGGAFYSFTVSFSDNQAIDVTSLDGNDIRVTGPGGFSQLATFVSVAPAGNGTQRTATYQIAAPGGAWDGVDTGTYTVGVEASQIFDEAGNPLDATSLGSFLVSLEYITYVPLALR